MPNDTLHDLLMPEDVSWLTGRTGPLQTLRAHAAGPVFTAPDRTGQLATIF